MMRNKALIFDVDGTVVDSPTQKMPSSQMIQAFNDVAGQYYLCAATGRPWTYAKGVLRSLTKDPCIVAAGTQIRNPLTEEILWECVISEESLQKALAILASYDTASLLYNDCEEDDYLQGRGIKVAQLPLDQPIHFLETIFVPEKDAPSLQQRLSAVQGITCTMVVAQRPGYRDLHITNEFATKEHAIAELLKIIQVDIDKTIGVGDGHNDLHLFAGVMHKVAMGNAVPELKNIADEVIGSVQDDGLAAFLRKLHAE